MAYRPFVYQSRLQHVRIEFDAKKSVHDYVLKAKESLIQKLERENFRLHEEAQRYKPDSDLLRAKLIEAENLKKEVLTLKEPILRLRPSRLLRRLKCVS